MKGHTTTTLSSHKVLKWRKLGYNAYKDNWDATLDDENSKLGAGVVIRNWEGELIASLSMPKGYVNSLVVAEALALQRVVLFCMEYRKYHF